MELRVLALYPEQMNIYADRGNIIFLRRRCEWRGIEFSYAAAGPVSGSTRRARPDLHRRRPGPRPAAGRRATWSRPSARRSPRRSTTAPSCSRSAAATSCSGHSYQLGDERIEGSGWPISRRSASRARG